MGTKELIILAIVLFAVCLIVLAILVKALISALTPPPEPTPVYPPRPSGSPASRPAAAPSPSVIYGMKRTSPQVTVYANPIAQNAFRCPVCDSRPAPSAKYCQVCGQPFQNMGGN